MNLIKFTSSTLLIDSFILELKSIIDKHLETKNSIAIAFSGGKSPIALFEALSNTPLPWNKVSITLVDERITDVIQDTNKYLINTYLQQNKARDIKYIEIDQLTQIDIAILGMGEDGHTASIFLDAPEFNQAVDLDNDNTYISINPKQAKYSRISLTLQAIIKVPHLFLIISGEDKLKVLTDAAANFNYPISYVLAHKPLLKILWHK